MQMTSSKKRENVNVLVAVLPETKDWQLLHEQLWYRIPVGTAPPIIRDGKAEFIAFYHTAKFQEDLKWKVVKFARIKRIVTATRQELFPHESPLSKKARKRYFKIEFDELIELEQPIVSLRGHRIVFVPTSEERFFSGTTNFNRLFKGSPLEEQMADLIDSMAIAYEREWCYYVDKDKFYYLDFAIFCKDGNIDIECDGDEFHTGNEHVHYDKTRNNELESYKWSVLRYTTKHFREEKEHIRKTLYKTIDEYGGVLSVSEPDVVYYPKANVKGQFNLFQNRDLEQ